VNQGEQQHEAIKKQDPSAYGDICDTISELSRRGKYPDITEADQLYIEARIRHIYVEETVLLLDQVTTQSKRLRTSLWIKIICFAFLPAILLGYCFNPLLGIISVLPIGAFVEGALFDQRKRIARLQQMHEYLTKLFSDPRLRKQLVSYNELVKASNDNI
jgi:hypothetical protein